MRGPNRLRIFAELDDEWHRFARSPEAKNAVQRWRRQEVTLSELHTVADVLVMRRNPARADAVLRTLVERAPIDAVAARVVLQAIIPGLVRIAKNLGGENPNETACEVVSIAWERISAYPGHRPGSVASNILYDVRKKLRSEREPLEGITMVTEQARSAEDIALEHVWLDELRSYEQHVSGDAGSFELVVANRIEGHSIVDLARDRGMTSQCLLMRRRRAEQRLRHHMAAA